MRSVMSALRSLAKEKVTVTRRENELLGVLNQLLPPIGYKVVRTDTNGPSRSATPPMTATTAKSLACPHCDRRFAKPLHLGRHISATHKNGAERRHRVARATKRAARPAAVKRKKAA